MSTEYAELDGLKNAMNHYAVFRDMMPAKIMDALAKFALRIVANAQKRLTAGRSVVTGHLRQSGSVRPQMDGTLQAGFSEGYAYFVEYGRRAGGFPPVDVIEQWVRTKHNQGAFSDAVTDEDLKNLAYLIARKIYRKGYQPKPFLMPAVAEERKTVNKFWTKAYKDAVNAIDR